MIESIKVTSTMLDSASFDTETNKISVTFPKGGEYEYPAYPELWEAFKSASSKGKFFIAYIRPLGGTKK